MSDVLFIELCTCIYVYIYILYIILYNSYWVGEGYHVKASRVVVIMEFQCSLEKEIGKRASLITLDLRKGAGRRCEDDLEGEKSLVVVGWA